MEDLDLYVNPRAFLFGFFLEVVSLINTQLFMYDCYCSLMEVNHFISEPKKGTSFCNKKNPKDTLSQNS
jgi:hypothetical protein